MDSLVPTEIEDLERFEAVISHGLETFIEVGSSLLEIRDRRLYRLDHGTFEDYCRERWGLSCRHANRLIESAKIAENLRPIGPIPETESQARPLASLPPEQQREVWQQAVETAPNGKVTAKHVAEVVETFKEDKSANKDLPGQGQFPFDPKQEETFFLCPECQEDFHYPVWHCPGCHHHWIYDEELCGNCYKFERREDGSIVYVQHDSTEDDDESDEAISTEEEPFDLSPEDESTPSGGKSQDTSPPKATPRRPVPKPLVNLGNGPTFPRTPGVRSTACFERWVDHLNNIIINVREHDGIAGSVEGLTFQEKTFLFNHFVRFREHLDSWISYLESNR